jgi:uncharacterized protein (TIGR03067 family)
VVGALVHGALWLVPSLWFAAWVRDGLSALERFNLKLPWLTEQVLPVWRFIAGNPLAPVVLLLLVLVDAVVLYGLARIEPSRVLREVWSGLMVAAPLVFTLVSGLAVALPYQKLFEGATRFADKHSDAVQKEQQRLAGVWKPVRVERDGKATDLADSPDRLRLDGQQFTWTRDGEEAGGLVDINLRTRPAGINLNWTNSAEQGCWQGGIYKFEGKRLTLCLPPVNALGDELPASFDTRGTKCELTVFERQGDE